jgi:hypothetical protein
MSSKSKSKATGGGTNKLLRGWCGGVHLCLRSWILPAWMIVRMCRRRHPQHHKTIVEKLKAHEQINAFLLVLDVINVRFIYSTSGAST